MCLPSSAGIRGSVPWNIDRRSKAPLPGRKVRENATEIEGEIRTVSVRGNGRGNARGNPALGRVDRTRRRETGPRAGRERGNRGRGQDRGELRQRRSRHRDGAGGEAAAIGARVSAGSVSRRSDGPLVGAPPRRWIHRVGGRRDVQRARVSKGGGRASGRVPRTTPPPWCARRATRPPTGSGRRTMDRTGSGCTISRHGERDAPPTERRDSRPAR